MVGENYQQSHLGIFEDVPATQTAFSIEDLPTNWIAFNYELNNAMIVRKGKEGVSKLDYLKQTCGSVLTKREAQCVFDNSDMKQRTERFSPATCATKGCTNKCKNTKPSPVFQNIGPALDAYTAFGNLDSILVTSPFNREGVSVDMGDIDLGFYPRSNFRSQGR